MIILNYLLLTLTSGDIMQVLQMLRLKIRSKSKRTFKEISNCILKNCSDSFKILRVSIRRRN